MCMMMKEPNDKNGKQIIRPCMGIPGMHGVAVLVDPEDFLRVLEAIEGGGDNADAQDKADVAADENKENDSYDYDSYKDEGYYSLSCKGQKIIDMVFC